MKIQPRRWLLRAAILSLLVALIHMVVTPVYFRQWLGYGAFFFVAATGQAAYAAVLAINRSTHWMFWVGIVANAGIVVMWAITRTIGIPFFGPMAGEVEPVGVLDLLATGIELVLIAHLAVLLPHVPELRKQPLIR